LPVRLVDFRNVTQALDSLVQFNEDTEWCMTNYTTANRIADMVGCEELFPHIRLKLLDSE
jgi:hypothetical protein